MKLFKQWAWSDKNCSLTSKLLINEVQANPNIMRMEMTKHFRLVASSLRNTDSPHKRSNEGRWNKAWNISSIKKRTSMKNGVNDGLV